MRYRTKLNEKVHIIEFTYKIIIFVKNRGIERFLIPPLSFLLTIIQISGK